MIACPQCHTENRSDNKFCTHCGLSLAESVPVSPPAAEPLPVSARPTMPLPETAVPPVLEDLTPQIAPSDAGAEQPAPLTFSFEPLPEGALVGPYLVRQFLDEHDGVHRYYVVDDNGENTAVYLLKESASWETLAVEIELAKRQLSGDGLQSPLRAFKCRIGTMRYFVLLPPAGNIIGNLQVPLEAPLALNYGVSLARGLAVLHEQQIGFGNLDARRIAVSEEEACLSEFAGCIIPGNPQQYNQEVEQLAALLYKLFTGKSEFTSQNNLPQDFQPLFTQILGQQQPMTAAEFAKELARLSDRMRRPESIDLRVGRQTDVGMLRQLNEDSLCTMELVWNNQSVNRPVGVYVIADGMGGHEGGEIASGLTIKAIVQLATEDLFTPTANGNAPDYDTWLVTAVEAANTAVYERSQNSRNDMGTTVVMALMVGDEAHIAHVGDSRAYHITAEGITQITTDHSLVERLVATGQISREEAHTHPQSNVIYRTIGDKPKIEVDRTSVRIDADEYLLLCSDGLNGMIPDERIHQIVTQATSPQTACAELINAANLAGGDDNITVIIVKPEVLT